jgi:hypothetical protein
MGSANQYGVLVDDRTHAYVFHWYFLSCLWEVWDPIHTQPGLDSLPAEYVDIRRCIRDLESLLADGRQVRAHVEGRDTATGEERDLTGRITEVSYVGESAADPTPLVELAGRATLTLEVDGREYHVGGWGAILEGIEATRVTITESPPPLG